MRALLLSLMLSLAWIPTTMTAHAAIPMKAPIPVKVFGKGTHRIFFPDCSTGLSNCMDNEAVNTQFDQAQDGTPLWHQVSQDELGRVGGWMEIFSTGDLMQAAVLVNDYGVPTDSSGAQVAFEDLLETVEANSVQLSAEGGPTFASLKRPAFDVPSGQSAAWSLTDGQTSLYVFGMWRGQTEVEAEVLYVAHAGLSGRAKRGLVTAVRDALAVDAAP